MFVRACVQLLLVCALLPSFTAAQEKPEPDTLNLEQLMAVQFYTASKHAQEASETPASVTIITRADIRAYGYRTLADVLQGVRGFWVNSDRNYSYLGVRGFARPGDYNTRILLLINGHRLNDSLYDQALIGTEFPLDVDLISRIEIVRGPSSSLYGTDAFFGVINVITEQPSLNTRVEASIEAGSEFTRKARVTVGLPKILEGALLSASMYRSDGNGRLYFPEFDSPNTNNGIARGVDGDSSASAYALLKWQHFQFQALAGSRQKHIPTASFGTIFNDPDSRTIDSRGFGDLSYQRDFASGIQLMSRWFYDGYAYNGTYPVNLGGSRVVEYDSGRGDWAGTELTLSRQIGHRNTVTGGTELRYNLRQNQHTSLSSVVALDIHNTSSVFALYGEDELKLTNTFTFNAGLRLDHYSTFGSAASPRAAVIFRPSHKSTIKYAFGRAFRAPNVYELYYADDVSQERNPALRPETIESHNIALERVLTSSLHLVTEAFYNSLNHLIDQRLDPVSNLYQYANAASDRGKGLEVQLDLQRGGLRGELSYTLQRTTDHLTHSMLANSPVHLAKAKWQAPLGSHLAAGAELDYESPQLTYTSVRVASSLNTNVTLTTRKPVLGFDISVSCYNLLDRRNFYPAPPALVESRLLQEGRGMRAKITRKLGRD